MTLTKQQTASLDRFLEDRKELDVSGNSLLIFHKDQEVYRHYSGVVQADSIFRVCSMTKVVTVVAALQLYEQGLFAMDDPVAKFLPAFANMTVWDEAQEQAVPAKHPILMRHLFSMSAGITYEGNGCKTERQYRMIRDRMEQDNPGCGYSTQE